MSYLTPEAKSQLSTTIRNLRTRLLKDLRNAAESAYFLSITPITKANLAEEPRKKRERLEDWLDEQVRAELGGLKKAPKNDATKAIRDRYLQEAIKLAAATLLNRLVVLRQLEALELSRPYVVTGGWSSPGYRQFREFAPDLCKDDTEGYALLLSMLYEELALELPGLFGPVSLTELFPIPASTLRAVIEDLNALDLDTWLDDTTLGWVYQYWNDPDREALDAKLHSRGKLEPYEIASKTQMFTERYMVEWLLHNSLGQIWLAMGEQNGWTPEVKSSGTLDALEERRKAWREKRENGEVTLDALMPTESDLEERWKYWVPQPMLSSLDAETGTGSKPGFPNSLKDIKILDPACGSGHFLVIALGLLFALYQEEARHRGEPWSDKAIVEWILERNLYGVDLDTRAVQIAAASLWLKAKVLCPEASPKQLNLVASNLNLATLPEDDPALVELRREVAEATGVSEELTNQVVEVLEGADQWGSLLKIDEAIRDVVRKQEQDEMPLFTPQQRLLEFEEKIRAIDQGLERFLQQRTRGDDLGLRLRGEQLAAGVRFIRIVREGSYDLVIGNPPYQGTSKMKDAIYVARYYEAAKADLYAAFLQRGLELAKPAGLSALLTMRNWMFISQFTDIRDFFHRSAYIQLIGDLHFGAFTEMKDVSVAMSILRRSQFEDRETTFIRPVKYEKIVRDSKQIYRNISGLISPDSTYRHPIKRFDVIKDKPIIYWWDMEFLRQYFSTAKLGDQSEVRVGLQTADNTRFLKKPWEVSLADVFIRRSDKLLEEIPRKKWVPYIKGASGKAWFEPADEILSWEPNALAIKLLERDGKQASRPQNERFYFKAGVAVAAVGSRLSARLHRFLSVFDVMGQSIFPEDSASATCLMNTQLAQKVLASLNPTIHFQVGDIKRLPLFPIESADKIFAQLDQAFTEHESARETSVEFKQPGPSCWVYAQDWAQQAVDRPAGDPLPDWQPTYDQPSAKNWVSYAIGVALGRFHPHGQGILNPDSDDISQALPYGILYLSDYSGDDSESKDRLNHSACDFLKDTWAQYGESIAHAKSLRQWLRLNFFKDVHLGMYDQRPIYFPLSSEKKYFVAYINIHRWTDTTLTDLLAYYLTPELNTLEGELADLLDARSSGDKKAQVKAQERADEVRAYYDDLKPFIERVRQCAEQGPPKADPKAPDREANAKYVMDLDDGVMVNSSALWPLLTPQWDKPKQWWAELCTAKGKKDYDWSHLAARYFPHRVDAKCQEDPSLAVAHGCFWKYHPAKAYEWELRLQDEIAPDFTIDEQDSATHRQEFEEKHPQLVQQLIEKEEKRRERNRKKAAKQVETDPLADTPLDMK
jgi:hypothetical protein